MDNKEYHYLNEAVKQQSMYYSVLNVKFHRYMHLSEFRPC